MNKLVNFSCMNGRVISKVTIEEDAIHFYMQDGKVYKMYHEQECCEEVYIEDICGDWEDIVGFPIVESDESSNLGDDESSTWTFYRIWTTRGDISIRWYGSSNGYYSESVDFVEVK